MSAQYRKYEIIIEACEDEQVNLQRFLLKCHNLSITCFASQSLNIINGVFAQPSPNAIAPSLIPGLIGQ